MDQLPALSALKTQQDGTNFTAYVNDDRLLQGRNGCLAPKKKKKSVRLTIFFQKKKNVHYPWILFSIFLSDKANVITSVGVDLHIE